MKKSERLGKNMKPLPKNGNQKTIRTSYHHNLRPKGSFHAICAIAHWRRLRQPNHQNC